MKIKTLFYLLMLLLPVSASSQFAPLEDHTHEIAEMESHRYQNYKPAEATRTGGDIDMVYTRFYWEIDPAIWFIRGEVSHYFKALVPGVSSINLELNATMTIDSILYGGELLSHSYYSDFQFSILLPNSLEQGVLDSVQIFYHGVPEQGNGFGSFGQAEHEGVPIVWTLSEPYGAKDWWPGKNDLNDKIDSIDVIVKSPAAYRAASHGLLVSEFVEGDYRISHWRHRYPIVSYLVAVAVTNYAVFTQYAIVDGDSMPIVNYVYPEDSAQAVSHSENTAQIIHIFDSLFGNYPFAAEKYGHAQFSQGGGMEHQTMSFMQGFGHDLRAHELAHSWFGNKITLATWHDIFLNEGFATYATGLTFEQMYDGYYWNIWKHNTRMAATDGPAGSVYVEDTTDISRIFSGRLSYHKGAYLLHMLRWRMGDAAFFDAVRNYVSDPMLAYRFATLNDLIAHLETAADTTLGEFFADWYYGEGYPIFGIEVEQMQTDGKIHITINQEQTHPSVKYFEMLVPITIYGQGSEQTYLCDNSFSGQEYIFDAPGFTLDSAHFDNDQWLLARLDTIILGVDDKQTRAISVHPNPASTHIAFFIPDQHINKVRIYSYSGILVFENKTELINEKMEININKFSKGLYILRAETESGNFQGKFVKQ